ncbi:MAG: hypothetical protein ABF241_01225, partial [Yoonia sp.]
NADRVCSAGAVGVTTGAAAATTGAGTGAGVGVSRTTRGDRAVGVSAVGIWTKPVLATVWIGGPTSSWGAGAAAITGAGSAAGACANVG